MCGLRRFLVTLMWLASHKSPKRFDAKESKYGSGGEGGRRSRKKITINFIILARKGSFVCKSFEFDSLNTIVERKSSYDSSKLGEIIIFQNGGSKHSKS